MSKEQKTTQEEDNREESVTLSQDVVEVSWEDAREVFLTRRELLENQQYLSDFLLSYERRKSALISRLEILENQVYQLATSIQEKYSVDPELIYEFKLPSQEGEKAYFIRKEE